MTTPRYIYIVQYSLEPSFCKIGKTNDLEQRLKDYNSTTGKSNSNVYQYLFTCEVSDATQVEKDIKSEFSIMRETKNREIYFYNSELFKKYIGFIKSHKLFIKEIFVKVEPKPVITEKIIKKTTPSLQEREMSFVDVMNRAKRVKNDEFYTRYEDVEKELSMYDKAIWEDKVIFCNCDDAVGDTDKNTSAFALYFIKNFNELGLKKLICTHYGGGYDLFRQGSKGYIYTRIFTKNSFKDEKEYPKSYTGSFDDPISLRILNEEADIVCTNPPFSRSIEYWKLIIESGKKFLIISNVRIAIHTRYLPYFKDHKAWAGYNRVDWFENPKRQLTDASGHWYTNLPVSDRSKYEHLKIMPLKKIPVKYKNYDDNKILLVDNCYIPSDYKKPFAVSTRPVLNGLLEKGYKIADVKEYIPVIKGKTKFSRVLVQKVEVEVEVEN